VIPVILWEVKTMHKKYIALIAAFFLFFVFLASSYGGTLDQIMDRRKIVFGVKYDFPPFGYMDDVGELRGFDIYIANYIARKMGVVPEFKRVTTMERINSLLNGDIDIIIASMTMSPYRKKIINFTNTYFVDGQGMLSNSWAALVNENDLNNKIIAVIMGSTAERYISSNPINYKALSLYHDYQDALESLREGRVDVIITDFSWCAAQQKVSDGKLVATGTKLTTEHLIARGDVGRRQLQRGIH
jgi:polar amino acid transport system substrate-binding protein